MRARGFASAAMLFLGAGCVPLSDYNALKQKMEEQEKYVVRHKDEVKELEKREQFLTLQAREKEKDMELLRTRLAKSEHLRAQMEAGLKSRPAMEPAVVQASAKPQQSSAFAGFQVNKDTGGIVLDHDILFASGESNLKSSGKRILDELVSKLNSSEFGRYIIRVDGHTDDAPVVKTKNTNHDNWELGAKRAKVVLDYMISKGISPERCFFASFGQYRPLIAGSGIKEMKEPKEEPVVAEKGTKGKKKHHTKKSTKESSGGSSATAQNRRVEIVLFEK